MHHFFYALFSQMSVGINSDHARSDRWVKKSLKLVITRNDYFWFGSVFIKKIIKPKCFLKKSKPVQINRFWFGSIFYDKNQFKSVWLGFL